jgi:hypothetical protein
MNRSRMLQNGSRDLPEEVQGNGGGDRHAAEH